MVVRITEICCSALFGQDFSECYLIVLNEIQKNAVHKLQSSVAASQVQVSKLYSELRLLSVWSFTLECSPGSPVASLFPKTCSGLVTLNCPKM